MFYALQDEPEKGRRWAILGIGAVIALGLQGGGLYSAYKYKAPAKPRRAAVMMKIIEQAPPTEAPPSEAPPTEAPPSEAPPTAPPTEAPKPKPKPKPKKPKPKPRKPKPKKPDPPKPEPEQPKTAAPKTAPFKIKGLTYGTDKRGTGPVVQKGNAFGGGEGGKGRKVSDLPPPPDPPASPETDPPVRKGARVRKKVKPKYTRAALRANIEGQVIVFVNIGADGKVTKIKLIKGLGYGLDEVALEAVEKWLFSPATVDGKPIASTKRIKVDFVIEE